MALSPFLPPKHLHRARRWDDRPRARGVVDMAAGMAGCGCTASLGTEARSRRASLVVLFVEL